MTVDDLNITFPIPTPTKRNFVNLTGRRFGRWIVLAYAGRGKRNVTLWLCLCDCRNVKAVNGSLLKQSRSTSCGCYKAEIWGKGKPIHGETVGGTESVEYRAYRSARQRCNTPTHHAYANYGGRGIQFRFPNFPSFLAELGRRPSPEHSLDREDTNGHYEPGNVRWATDLEQSRNKRNVRSLTAQGKTLLLPEWEEITGIPREILHQRLNRQKWCPECVVGIPLKHSPQNNMCPH